ncbi:MAG: MBL fold metallo-hydrolase [Betaproteobacteria bacterium]|nr:MAG: MBL fold metallo-hydrolase [Betaproteobacteria bacterium]
MRLSFLGGAGEVTGSCTLIESGYTRFLVDCGMFQGGHEAWGKNMGAFAFDPGRLDFVLLTHAHIDHSGLLPRLAAMGNRGPIHVTTATAELLQVMLLDSAHLQEKEAEWRSRHRDARRQHPMAPLYTVDQARACLKQLHPVAYETEFHPHPGVSCTFRDAGHILGSAIVDARVRTGSGTRHVVFSGDLGQAASGMLPAPARIDGADVLLVESTYGNRLHKTPEETRTELARAIGSTLPRGNVIIPAFAVGRTQAVLYALAELARAGRLPPLRVFIDSPMAEKATLITRGHLERLAPQMRELDGWMRRNPAELQLRYTHDVEDSKALNQIRSGAIVISASGMCDAGRIKHHLRWNLPRRECAVLITGFQAEGTLGRRLVDGARNVRIFNDDIPVRAKVHTIGGLSAHADRDGLLAWLRGFTHAPGRTFVVHGEREAALSFADALRGKLGWTHVEVPQRGDTQIL